MKAAELIRNEPFAKLFTATLSDFLTLRFGGEWRVAWKERPSSSEAQRWLVNLNINAIFLSTVSRRALENIKREFATSVIPWKRPFQRFYFWLATSQAARFAAHAVVEVKPPVPGAGECVIIPGTHKIRFVDAAAGMVYCHLKKGSNPEHFQAEIKAREFAADNGVPVPSILRRLSEACIAEQMVVGTPLNRITSSQRRAEGLGQALRAMEPLYRATARQAPLHEYAASLITQLTSIAAADQAILSSGALRCAQLLAAQLHPADATIELARSHGDFQPGNLLYDKGAIWLIDWEYSREWQRQYDFLTYTLGTRFKSGLGGRIAAYADSLAEVPARQQLQVFLIESILYEAEAAMVSTSHSSSRSLIGKLAEFDRAMPAILRDGKA